MASENWQVADLPWKNYLHNIPAARNLRRPMTPTEEVLWERLRDRRLGDLKFRRQHAIGRFVVDFYCHERRLIVELDGSIHLEPSQRQRDRERQFELEEKGLSFLRFTNEEVTISLDSVVAQIANFAPSSARHEPGEAESLPGA